MINETHNSFEKMRVSVIAGDLSSSEASTKTNVSVTFSSVKFKPVRKRYGECGGRRGDSDKSDKIEENEKGDRVRQKRRVKFIHKKENYYERRRRATPAK